MFLNKKGAALLQVLMVTAVLAGIATMILRASLARVYSSRKMLHEIKTQLAIESCMAEVNNIWASKKAEYYMADLNNCVICSDTSATGCDNNGHQYTCQHPSDANYPVIASMQQVAGRCQITYSIANGVNL